VIDVMLDTELLSYLLLARLALISVYTSTFPLSVRMANMFLLSQLIVLCIGTLFVYSEKKLVKVLGRILQVIAGLAIVLDLAGGVYFWHHHIHAQVPRQTIPN
jgi:hypothetical protein